MPDPLAFLIAVLATFRIGELLTIDEGPWMVFFRIRVWAGVYDTVPLGGGSQPISQLGRLFDCPYCLGVWVALFAALLLDFSPRALLLWPAIAGGQALLQTIGGRSE